MTVTPNSAVSQADHDQLIADWSEKAKQLAIAKAAEAEARMTLLTVLYGFSTEAERSGTENIELGNGYKLKAVFKMTPKLDNTGDKVDSMLAALEAMGAAGQLIAARLVKWSPELSITEYKQLPPEMKVVVDAITTFKPATPAVELVVPKSA